MNKRTIGSTTVSAVGLGAMHFSFAEPRDDDRSIRAVHAALDAGVRLIDTALCYTVPSFRCLNDDGINESHNEWLVEKALRTHPDGRDVLVATKGGHYREGTEFPKDARPESIKMHCEISLRTLGVEALGLYQLHWPDPKVPIAEAMGAFADLQQAGKVQLIGVSNFSIEQIEEALTVCAVASVQNRFNPWDQQDRSTLDYATAKGIAYLPWAPLTGRPIVEGDGFATVAANRGVSVPQVVIAWHLAQAPNIIPIPGTRRAEAIVDCAAAADLELTPDELSLLG